MPLLVLALLFVVCGLSLQWLQTLSAPAQGLDRYAREYVRLALAAGQHSPEDVDAYFGDPALQPDPKQAPLPLADLQSKAHHLSEQLLAMQAPDSSDRRQRLLAKLAQLSALLDLLQHPKALGFVQEAQQVYGLTVPSVVPDTARYAIAQLDKLLPGPGSLATRVQHYRDGFKLPADLRKSVFEAALAECMRRNSLHWPLPADEALVIEWTRRTDAAWHRYEGHHRSRLQINPDALTYEEAAVDIACHEAYPGHHTQFLLLEQSQEPQGLMLEDTVVLLRTADSVRREGAAELGIQLAFPMADRIVFERDVLFPLAGLPPAQARQHVEVMHWVNEASSAIAPILAQYRDGQLSTAEAAEQLQTYAVVTNPAGLLAFTDEHGAYAAGYTVARDALRQIVAPKPPEGSQVSWQMLKQQLTQVIKPELAETLR